MNQKCFRIVFSKRAAEEFHSGNGLGKMGVYDAGQQSEVDESVRVPMVRDDTVKGLLRDACIGLVKDPLYQEEWRNRFAEVSLDQLRLRIFDYEAGDSLFITGLRPRVQELPSGDLFRIVTQTAIDEKGRAKERSLRSIECGRNGIELHGEVRGRVPADMFDAAMALICDGIMALRALGGRRRRGFGRLSQKAIQAAERDPRKTVNSAIKAGHASGKSGKASKKNAKGADKNLALILTLEAVEPIHVTAAGGQSGARAELHPWQRLTGGVAA